MQKRGHLYLPFGIFLLLSIILFFLFKLPIFESVRGVFEDAIHPFQLTVARVFTGRQDEVSKLQMENAMLRAQLAHGEEMQRENNALHDQFETTDTNPQKLLPAKIVGMEPFTPGIILPDFITLDKGTSDGVKTGQAVIVKNVLLGSVMTVSAHLAKIRLVSEKQTSFTVKDVKTNAFGIVKGIGNGEAVLTSVVLADKLGKDDIIVTAGSKTIEGIGLPEGLTVGTIVSIDKKQSNLFQAAALNLPFDVIHLSDVFIQTQ